MRYFILLVVIFYGCYKSINTNSDKYNRTNNSLYQKNKELNIDNLFLEEAQNYLKRTDNTEEGLYSHNQDYILIKMADLTKNSNLGDTTSFNTLLNFFEIIYTNYHEKNCCRNVSSFSTNFLAALPSSSRSFEIQMKYAANVEWIIPLDEELESKNAHYINATTTSIQYGSLKSYVNENILVEIQKEFARAYFMDEDGFIDLDKYDKITLYDEQLFYVKRMSELYNLGQLELYTYKDYLERLSKDNKWRFRDAYIEKFHTKN